MFDFQHTLVLPILFGEILLEPHIYPKTRNGLAALGFVGLAYLGWWECLVFVLGIYWWSETKQIMLVTPLVMKLFSCFRHMINIYIYFFFRIVWVYLTVGIWVYPILGLFSSSGLTIFFFHNMLVVSLLFLLGQTLNHKVWGKKIVLFSL